MDDIRQQWLLLISTPFYIGIIVLELLLTHLQHRKAYTLKDTIANVYLMLLNAALDLAFRAIVYFYILQYFYTHAFFTWKTNILYWIVLVIAEDFVYYWLHRFDHKIRFFWATHVTQSQFAKI